MVPLVALLYMLAVLRMTAWLATIIGGLITILLGVLVWHAPAGGHAEILPVRRAHRLLGHRLDHVLGPDHLQHAGAHRPV